MNARLPLTIARALAPFAPPASEVHSIVSEAEWEEADRHYLWLKTSGELDRRHDREAARLEMQQTTTDAWGWRQ